MIAACLSTAGIVGLALGLLFAGAILGGLVMALAANAGRDDDLFKARSAGFREGVEHREDFKGIAEL